jgi:ribose transport system substrate-binding protein
MSRHRFILWSIVLVALIAAVGYRMSVFREPPPLPAPKVAFITGGSGAYWQLTVNGAKAAAKEHRVDLKVEMPSESESLEQQMDILNNRDLANVDGIAISPLDAEQQTHSINKLVDRNKKVVTFDSDAPLSNRQSYIGTNNFAAGRTCARVVNEALPGGGKILVLVANLTKDNMLDRKGGFHERIMQHADDVEEGQPLKFEVVGYLVDNGRSDKCAENIRQTIEQHPDLACIVGMNARHGPILLTVLKELDKLGQIKLITFDYDDETLDGVEAGHIYATVAQDPYMFGYEAVATLAHLCRGDETSVPIVGKGSTYVGAEPIGRESIAAFRTRLKARGQSARGASDDKKST